MRLLGTELPVRSEKQAPFRRAEKKPVEEMMHAVNVLGREFQERHRISVTRGLAQQFVREEWTAIRLIEPRVSQVEKRSRQLVEISLK